MVIGLHCSVRQGFARALAVAESHGCEAMQILPYRRHVDPEEEDYAGFRELRAKSRVRRLLAHSRFVPSLASGNPEWRNRSAELLARELELSERLGAEALVVHPGAYSSGGEARRGVSLAAGAVARALEHSGSSLAILIENVPGGGRRLGGSLEELAALLENLTALAGGEGRFGICLDTAHAWAAGYDLSSGEGMSRFLERAKGLFGPGRVRAFHLNDTAAVFDSHRENHEAWGKGVLGRGGLSELLAHPDYADAPGILETPRASENARSLEFVRS